MPAVRIVRVIMGIVLGVLLFGVSDARAVVAPTDLRGSHFAGIFESSRNPGDVGFFDVFFDSFKARSFTCRLVIHSVSPPEPEIPCQGTLSAAGVFEVIARRGVFQVHGRLGADGIALAHYHFGDDDGTLLMLQQTSGQPPDPGVFGRKKGDFSSMTTGMDGTITLDVVKGEMADALMMVTEETMDDKGNRMEISFSFDIFVSSLPPDPCTGDRVCMHPFSMIGLSTMGDPGVFVVRGTLDAGGAMGEFAFYPAGIGNPDFMDAGMFDVAVVGPD